MVELFAILKQYRNGMVAVLMLVVALVLMLAIRSHEPGRDNFVSDAMLDIIGPVQRVFLSPVVAYRRLENRFIELKQLDLDNKKLRAQLQYLMPLGTRMEELEQENQRLRRLLNIPVNTDYQRMAARVVGEGSSAFASSIIINAGLNDGVSVNAIVVVPEGLLGRVVRVGSHTSLVLTLLDLNSRIPVLVQQSRTRGIAAGVNGRKLFMDFVSKTDKIEVGDMIVTSGTGEGFPKGLAVGRVEKIVSGSGLFRQVIIAPVVDFHRVEEVTLLLPTKREGDEALELDASFVAEP